MPGRSFDYTPNTTFRGPRRVLGALAECGRAARARHATSSLVGGKAAGAARRCWPRGLPVPDGFAVTTPAFA